MKKLIFIFFVAIIMSKVYSQSGKATFINQWLIVNDSLKYTSESTKDNVEMKILGDSCFKHIDIDVYLKPHFKAYFPGGKKALKEFIINNIEYQEYNKVSVVVIVGFIVTSDGSINKIGIRKGVNDSFDLAAIKLINKMPKWIPAQNDGKNIHSFVLLPISFEIE
ncbi:MAG: hypothetical protein GQ564_06355 [Bacteroidales bacterium]|nr:hypothetical protein [Bacteroidales bacterium]